jgi:hypothetical protein
MLRAGAQGGARGGLWAAAPRRTGLVSGPATRVERRRRPRSRQAAAHPMEPAARPCYYTRRPPAASMDGPRGRANKEFESGHCSTLSFRIQNWGPAAAAAAAAAHGYGCCAPRRRRGRWRPLLYTSLTERVPSWATLVGYTLGGGTRGATEGEEAPGLWARRQECPSRAGPPPAACPRSPAPLPRAAAARPRPLLPLPPVPHLEGHRGLVALERAQHAAQRVALAGAPLEDLAGRQVVLWGGVGSGGGPEGVRRLDAFCAWHEEPPQRRPPARSCGRAPRWVPAVHGSTAEGKGGSPRSASRPAGPRALGPHLRAVEGHLHHDAAALRRDLAIKKGELVGGALQLGGVHLGRRGREGGGGRGWVGGGERPAGPGGAAAGAAPGARPRPPARRGPRPRARKPAAPRAPRPTPRRTLLPCL